MSDSSNGSTSSLALLAIDALTEFERVVDAIPAPGRGGPIGRLNPGWWTVLHVTRQADFVQSFATGEPRDPWVVEHADAEERLPFDDVRAALARTRERLVAFCASASDEDLARVPLTEPVEGLPALLVGVPLQQILARTTAHLFAHAGELSALASLMGAPDLGLPGAMAASRGLEPSER
jgi:DinB family protein